MNGPVTMSKDDMNWWYFVISMHSYRNNKFLPLSNESALYIQPRCMKCGRWYLQAVVVVERQPKRGIKLKCVHRNIACSTYICGSYKTIEYSRACITFIGLVTGGHFQPPPPISSPVVCLALYRHSWRIAVWLLCKQLH